MRLDGLQGATRRKKWRTTKRDRDARPALWRRPQGRTWTGFFHQWLLEPGYPVLQISQEWYEVGGETVLTLKQVQDAAWPASRFQIEVEIELSTGTTRTPVEISARRSVIRIQAAESPRNVRFDPDGWVLKDIGDQRP
jgi:aminopeptidase N